MLFFGKKKKTNFVDNWRDTGKNPEFDNIWKKTKYKADSMLALEAFCAENDAPWYGYFLLGAAYDCNACGLPFDMEKAQHYYDIAQEKVKVFKDTLALSFFNIFMEYRSYEPGNLFVDLDPLTRQIRRTGFGAVGTHIGEAYLKYNKTVEEGNTLGSIEDARAEAQIRKKEIIYKSPVYWPGFLDTIPYQYKIFKDNSVRDIELYHTIEPLKQYFLDTLLVNHVTEDFKRANSLIKEHNAMIKNISSCSPGNYTAEMGEKVYDDFKYLILGKALELAKACPFDYVSMANAADPYYPYRTGWYLLNLAVSMGSVAAAIDLSFFLRTEYWSNQFSEFFKGNDPDDLSNSQKLGRQVLREFADTYARAGYDGKQHVFADTDSAVAFCQQYFSSFADSETLNSIIRGKIS